METISFSVLLTRREYLDYKTHMTPRHLWPFVTGAVVIAMGVWRTVIGAAPFSLSLLLLLLGVVMAGFEPLILPLWHRGQAAREYDDNQALQKASTYTFTEKTLVVENAWLHGSLPLAALTAAWEEPEMLCVFFGAELQALIPERALKKEQLEQLKKWLEDSRTKG